MVAERTQVAIVGAGPAGLLLGRLLDRAGVDSVILERRDRAYVERRLRAGVLEQGTVDLLRAAGVGARMDREGLVHEGFFLQFDGARHRIPMTELTGGRAITVYGQHEVVKDLIAARLGEGPHAAGGPLHFEAGDLAVDGVDTDAPLVRYARAGESHELRCDFVAGCDGFHGVCRRAVPADAVRTYERAYPFGWLGILAATPPATHELIYAYHERGFALYSMRSPAVSRLYVQCAPDDAVEAWPDERVWAELHARLDTADGPPLAEGPVLEKGVTAMRSVVTEPMRYGRLFLAGDAAHVVPPTGAKGMNLAVADVRVLAEALVACYQEGRTDLLDAYSETCLRRVWRAEHFSWWMTGMLHRFPGDDLFQQRLQLSQLRYTCASTAAATSLAENYVGLERV